MYHEDNPTMLMELVQKSMMAYAITLVITLYYLEARMKVLAGGIHFGTWELNIVRGIAILLMHMSMYPNFRDSRNMLQFAINNVEKFAGAQITLPILLCLFKLSIAMLTEFGQIVLVMHYKTEYEVITGYVALYVITSLETKMMSLLRDSTVADTMVDKPLQYFAGQNAHNSFTQAKIFYKKWYYEEINSGWLEMIIITITIVCQWIVGFFYITIYYYLLPFTPIFVVMFSRIFDESYYAEENIAV